ncbi:MAG: 2-oxo acid dehydrogenase subunit E2 [Eubacteriales bacterium]|nr:2-oxo acid dehydrogenase subunit E2 [Eubacteriales bacterium]
MRKDGKRVKNVDNMYTIAPYFMRERSDACNSITIRIPYEPLHQYVMESRKNGKGVSYMAIIICAYLRIVGEYPALNRFVVNKKIYARNHVSVGMVVQRADGAEGSMGKMYFDLHETLEQVNEKIQKYVVDNRQEDSNSLDGLLRVLIKLSGLTSFVMWLLRWMDKHGLLPRSIIDASPFHNSMVISNLASIRTNHIYHHVYNFGTTSMIITMGNAEETPKTENGAVTLERQMPLGIVMDERVCSGSYYARSFRRFLHFCKNPSLMETPPETVNVDF